MKFHFFFFFFLTSPGFTVAYVFVYSFQGYSWTREIPYHHYLLLPRCHGNYASLWYNKRQNIWQYFQMVEEHWWGMFICHFFSCTHAWGKNLLKSFKSTLTFLVYEKHTCLFLTLYYYYYYVHFQHANEDVEKMILGNKCDMDDKRQVSKDRGDSVCISFF